MPVLTLDESLDILRGRFMRCRAGVPLHVLAKDIDLHPRTMKRFVDGGHASGIVLSKLQRWCDKMDDRREDTHGNP